MMTSVSALPLTRPDAAGPGASGKASGKLSSAAQEFESVLLGQWVQGAESSFGSVPGGDEDEDAGGEQMQGFGVQQLATQLAAKGGIGIARLVEKALVKASVQQSSGGTAPDIHDAASDLYRARSGAAAMTAYAAGEKP